jgi:hypothetical protein
LKPAWAAPGVAAVAPSAALPPKPAPRYAVPAPAPLTADQFRALVDHNQRLIDDLKAKDAARTATAATQLRPNAELDAAMGLTTFAPGVRVQGAIQQFGHFASSLPQQFEQSVRKDLGHYQQQKQLRERPISAPPAMPALRPNSELDEQMGLSRRNVRGVKIVGAIQQFGV